MKQVLKYPGAKTRLAPWICSYIPVHNVYLEPFFGSGAVFFNKQPCRVETINDINDDVYNYFKVLRDCPDELIRLIELTDYGRAEYESAWGRVDDFSKAHIISNVERARRFAVRCWMTIGGGNLYQSGFRSGQSSTSPNPAHTWSALPDVLRVASIRLKWVQIERLQALELISRYNTSDVFIYADPPYLHSTRKSNLYKHEMTDQDHADLLTVLKRHPGKVLISGYDNDLYNQELAGWRKETKLTLAEGGVKREEVLWMNYDPVVRLDL